LLILGGPVLLGIAACRTAWGGGRRKSNSRGRRPRRRSKSSVPKWVKVSIDLPASRSRSHRVTARGHSPMLIALCHRAGMVVLNPRFHAGVFKDCRNSHQEWRQTGLRRLESRLASSPATRRVSTQFERASVPQKDTVLPWMDQTVEKRVGPAAPRIEAGTSCHSHRHCHWRRAGGAWTKGLFGGAWVVSI